MRIRNWIVCVCEWVQSVTCVCAVFLTAVLFGYSALILVGCRILVEAQSGGIGWGAATHAFTTSHMAIIATLLAPDRGFQANRLPAVIIKRMFVQIAKISHNYRYSILHRALESDT